MDKAGTREYSLRNGAWSVEINFGMNVFNIKIEDILMNFMMSSELNVSNVGPGGQ